MKKTLSILFFLIIAVTSLKANFLPRGDFGKTSILNKIDTSSYPLSVYTSIDFAFYTNKSINTFLAYLDMNAPGYEISTIYSRDNPRRAARINIYYASNITFVLTVKDFQFVNPFSSDRNWDIVLFRQENICAIDLYQVGTLLHGVGD
jgi:hypothetical protein